MKKEELLEKVKEESKKQAIKEVQMTDEEKKLNEEMFKAANMPIEFTDKDFVLGIRELDIRKLSDENFKQMLFRLNCVQASQIRQLTQVVIDIERLFMLLLTTKGISASQLGNKLTELIDELTKESEKITREEQKGTQA